MRASQRRDLAGAVSTARFAHDFVLALGECPRCVLAADFTRCTFKACLLGLLNCLFACYFVFIAVVFNVKGRANKAQQPQKASQQQCCC